MIKILHCNCPNGHNIAMMAFDDSRCNESEVKSALIAMVESAELSACRFCQAERSQWGFKMDKTKFASIAEANKVLAIIQMINLIRADIFDKMTYERRN